MTIRRPILAALTAGALAAAGCGVDTEDSGQPTVASTVPAGAQSIPKPARRRSLPQRPAGTVVVDGEPSGGITPTAIHDYASRSNTRVVFERTGDVKGFQELCSGTIDVVDADREITAAELARCHANGVELTDQPFEVASDAVVVATKNEADVGGDCLTKQTVRDIFRTGSTIDNWNQVGFSDLALATTGPRDTTSLFQFFASTALGIDSSASLADVRADYRVRANDNSIRREVVNTLRIQRAIDESERHYRRRLRDTQKERRALVDRAERAADRRVLDQIARENRARQRRKVSLTPAQAAALVERNSRRDAQAKAAARARANARFDAQILTSERRRSRELLAEIDVPGVVGIFRFTYYELFENLLRPMEIWDPVQQARENAQATGKPVPEAAQQTSPTTTPTATSATGATGTGATGTTTPGIDTTQPDCVFPSQKTITTGHYPLSRRLLLYVSKQNIKRPEVNGFLTDYLAHAQKIASDQRLVPITDRQKLDQSDVVAGRDPSKREASGGGGTSTTSTTTTRTTTTPTPGGGIPGVGTPSQ